MRAVFADTSYFLALTSQDDEHHDRAVESTSTLGAKLITTAWVVTELADGYARLPRRRRAIPFLRDLVSQPGIEVMPATQRLFRAGFELYCQRADKEWSLTDCISFAVMERRRIREALSADDDFRQAGFVVLLA